MMDPWLILPILGTVAACWWCSRHDYSGSYNFTGLFTFPATAFFIALSWLAYFAGKALL